MIAAKCDHFHPNAMLRRSNYVELRQTQRPCPQCSAPSAEWTATSANHGRSAFAAEVMTNLTSPGPSRKPPIQLSLALKQSDFDAQTPASATTNSSRVPMLIYPISAPTNAAPAASLEAIQ